MPLVPGSRSRLAAHIDFFGYGDSELYVIRSCSIIQKDDTLRYYNRRIHKLMETLPSQPQQPNQTTAYKAPTTS